jgi:hypothetical protein
MRSKGWPSGTSSERRLGGGSVFEVGRETVTKVLGPGLVWPAGRNEGERRTLRELCVAVSRVSRVFGVNGRGGEMVEPSSSKGQRDEEEETPRLWAFLCSGP